MMIRNQFLGTASSGKIPFWYSSLACVRFLPSTTSLFNGVGMGISV
jgi:hypothetical protein